MKEEMTVATEDQNIDEGTAAAETLKPGAGSGGTESKAQTLATFTQLLSQLGKEDLSNLYNRTVEQIGKEADSLPAGANAAANKASVAAKSVKEDIDEMFSGDELTEELKERASVVFEAAVNTRMTLETARLEEEFEAKKTELEEQFVEALEEQIDQIKEDLSNKIDQYLDYVVEQYMEENKLPIETSLRTEITENFIKALQNTFAEHFITVPDEQVDLVAEMKAELDELKVSLNAALNEKLELESIVTEATKAAIFDEVTEGLAETQVEKLRSLAEGVEYVSEDVYKNKLNLLKENFSSIKKPSAEATTGLITEEQESLIVEEETLNGNDPMSVYVKTISKSKK